jgi:hypothetical protein
MPSGPSSPEDLIGRLNAYPGQEAGDLVALAATIDLALSATSTPELDAALLGLFERFPREDAFGIYWAVLHGLERRGDYEQSLVASLRRMPSSFGLRMLRRLASAGHPICSGESVLDLLKAAAYRNDVDAESRSEAEDLLAQLADRAV